MVKTAILVEQALVSKINCNKGQSCIHSQRERSPLIYNKVVTPRKTKTIFFINLVIKHPDSHQSMKTWTIALMKNLSWSYKKFKVTFVVEIKHQSYRL